MKYSNMVYGSCGCSPFLFQVPFMYPEWGTNDTVQYSNYILMSACSIEMLGYVGNWGDNTLYYEGGEATAGYYIYVNAYPVGTVAVAVSTDTTFASDSQLALSNQAALYQYLACFIMASSSNTFMPLGFVNNFTSATQCYTFCSKLNMPYAGMTYQGGT